MKNEYIFALAFGIFLLIVLIWVIFILLSDFRSTINPADDKLKEDEENKLLVLSSSHWYKKVIELNNSYSYHHDILDDGHTEHYVYVDSLSKFRKILVYDVFLDFVAQNMELIKEVLEKVSENHAILNKYEEDFQRLYSPYPKEKCDILEMDYNQYVDIEKQLVMAAHLPIIHEYTVTCSVVYYSPHGRNRDEKSYTYDVEDIQSAFLSIELRERNQKKQTDKRQNERSKMTLSLRYDILARDNFRCCVCGRSSDSGVELEVDHIVPISKGGETTYENLQTLCRDCNRGKGAKL